MFFLPRVFVGPFASPGEQDGSVLGRGEGKRHHGPGHPAVQPRHRDVHQGESTGSQRAFTHRADHINDECVFSCQDGETPLIKATKMRNIDIVELLLDKGAKVSAVDKVGDSESQKPPNTNCVSINSRITQTETMK